MNEIANEITNELAAAPAPASAVGSTTTRRRRSPATGAKIVTVGASVTAVLGMIAGYGIADRLTSGLPETEPLDAATSLPVATPGAEIPLASPAMTPATAAPSRPQVIVVVVDGATGRTLSTTNGTGDLVADLTAVGVTPSLESSPPAAPATIAEPGPAPIAPPASVELAVPAAPPPPEPNQQAAPAQPPQPQATSSGS